MQIRQAEAASLRTGGCFYLVRPALRRDPASYPIVNTVGRPGFVPFHPPKAWIRLPPEKVAWYGSFAAFHAPGGEFLDSRTVFSSLEAPGFGWLF